MVNIVAEWSKKWMVGDSSQSSDQIY